MAELRFDDRVAVVTGGGRGLGRAHAMLLAARGAKVVVNDPGVSMSGDATEEGPADELVREIRAAGGEAVANTDSVATPEGGKAIIETALDTWGRIDIVIHSAGNVRRGTLHEMSYEDFDSVIDVHLRGTFLCSQAFARQVVQQGGGGRIVCTTSVSGMLGNFGQANYAAAKAGVYGLMRTMSIELQKHRITVNAIAPIAKTRMTEDLPMFQGVATMSPEHIAPAVLFLASDLVGDRTGHVLAAAGSRMYAFKVVETAGKFKDDDAGVWTAQEIAEHWDAILKA